MLGGVGVVSLGRNKGFLASTHCPRARTLRPPGGVGVAGEGADSGRGLASVLRAKQGAIKYNAQSAH